MIRVIPAVKIGLAGVLMTFALFSGIGKQERLLVQNSNSGYLEQFEDDENILEPNWDEDVPSPQTKSDTTNTPETTNTAKNNRSDKEIEEEKILAEMKSLLDYGTYQDQAKIFSRFANNCKRNNDMTAVSGSITLLEKMGFFEKPFKNDGSLVLGVIDMIRNCRLVKYKNFIGSVLTDEFHYRDYPDSTKSEMKVKAWDTLIKFYGELGEKEKSDYAKLVGNYVRYDRYHNNDWKIKLAAIEAAAKLKPSGLNVFLKREYSEEDNADLKNAMIITIGHYQDIDDIDFLDKIVKSEGGSRVNRWVAVIAFTNYAPRPRALLKLKEYSRMPENEIASRAYYALSFYNLSLDFFINAARDNNESIRLQAVEAMSRFSLEEVQEVLEYKSTRDSSAAVREKAKKILKAKKENPLNDAEPLK